MDFFNTINFIWIAVAIITLLVLVVFKIRMPYGRHTAKGWGKLVSNHWAWFLMEIPALLIFPLMAIFGPREKGVLSWILITLWLIHYINRTLIFPFRIKTKGKKMPISILLSAIFFNGVNGFLNGYYIGVYSPSDEAWKTLHVAIGIIIFIIGFSINNISDTKLIALRKKHTGYQIPEKWLFKYISCPNHFGEITEWAGFAIVAWNLPATTFAIWTFCNLAPRALNHHAWYKENFQNYPQKRKAFLPFIW